MLGLNASGALVWHSCLLLKLRDTWNELTCVTQAFIARMAKLLVPWQLFCSGTNGTHWDIFVNDQLESTKIHAL